MNYYNHPFQVIFLRPDRAQPQYEKGIAFKDMIIASRDGGIFSTKEVQYCARRNGIDEDYSIVEGIGWVPFDIK